MARTIRPLRTASAALCLTLLIAAACSSNETPAASTTVGASTASPAASGSSPSACGEIPSAGSGGIIVKEGDFFIDPDSTSAPAGEVSFDIRNEGPQTHEFVVFKTDLDPANLPTNEDGTVDEEGQGLEHIDEVEGIATCTSGSLSANLAAGNYVFICNLPGHYGSGMHTGFTVR
jgi:uncharacterized cupredoxin-like copper-binding protein